MIIRNKYIVYITAKIIKTNYEIYGIFDVPNRSKSFFNKQKFNIYLYRFLGLLNSMFGKKSWYRNSDFNK